MEIDLLMRYWSKNEATWSTSRSACLPQRWRMPRETVSMETSQQAFLLVILYVFSFLSLSRLCLQHHRDDLWRPSYLCFLNCKLVTQLWTFWAVLYSLLRLASFHLSIVGCSPGCHSPMRMDYQGPLALHTRRALHRRASPRSQALLVQSCSLCIFLNILDAFSFVFILMNHQSPSSHCFCSQLMTCLFDFAFQCF